MAPNSDEFDEKAKPPVVQQRGRFKVTSESVGIEKVTWSFLAFISVPLSGQYITCFSFSGRSTAHIAKEP